MFGLKSTYKCYLEQLNPKPCYRGMLGMIVGEKRGG